jgi:hypothetical protein
MLRCRVFVKEYMHDHSMPSMSRDIHNGNSCSHKVDVIQNHVAGPYLEREEEENALVPVHRDLAGCRSVASPSLFDA